MAEVVVSLGEMANQMRATGQRLREIPRKLPLRAIAIKVRASIQEGFNSGISPKGKPWKAIGLRVRGGNKPLLDTGQLRNSIQAKEDGPNSVVASTNKIQGPLLHFGGVVRPKKGKYLAIPLTRQAQRTGSPRLFSQKLQTRLGPKGGVMMTVVGKGKRAREVPQYALVKQVTIPARPFLGFSKLLILEVRELLRAMIRKNIQGRN